VSDHVIWGKADHTRCCAVGKSIINPSSPANIGVLLLGYGGGGRPAAGTCQVSHFEADRVLADIVAALNVTQQLATIPTL
jgi:nanoRNase/pAp phosphatase (c-di-AMP/oligoRNAs hydrolase)